MRAVRRQPKRCGGRCERSGRSEQHRDALAVVLEANLPTFVAGSTKIVGALRRCDKSWRDALGAHPATKRLFARCAACGKFAWRCSDCQGVAQPGEERRRGPPRDEVLCLDCRHVDIEKSYGRTESSPWGGQLHIPAIHGPRPDRAPRPCIDCGTLVCLACCVKRDFDPWSTTRDMDEETRARSSCRRIRRRRSTSGSRPPRAAGTAIHACRGRRTRRRTGASRRGRCSPSGTGTPTLLRLTARNAARGSSGESSRAGAWL